MVNSVGTLLQELAELDVFFYVLPFLLIFSMVFAILQKLKLTGEDDRGINAVIALSVGLLSLQFDRVPIFFQEIFPRLGIGLSILLVALIMMGLFVNPQRHRGAVLMFLTIGGVASIFILLNAFNSYTWWTGGFWAENISAIVAGIIIIAFVAVVVNSGKESSGKFFEDIDQLGKKSNKG